jgi:hypothetical protein
MTEPVPVSYSAGLRRAFFLAALVVALLPIPVALLDLLPAYRIQTRFLVFYAPLVCLLALAYLFYVRDGLARLMFAHLLDPLPPRPEYYPERSDLRLRRLWFTVRRGLLALLPALLLLASFACLLRYVERVNESVALTSAGLARPGRLPEDVGQLPGSRSTVPAPTRVAAPTSLRDRALDVPSTEEIPLFDELTALYIGAFLTAVIALVVMGLREYAREALGLSEQDVVLGRVLAEPE